MEVNNKLIFRFATKEDCELVFSWINDPLVRQNSYNSDTIPFETHKNWFLGKIENPDSFYLIFYFNNIPAGQVRIDKNSENIIGILIDKNFRGKSLSSEMLVMAVNHFKTIYPDEIVTAHIKFDNLPSLKSFLKAGFAVKEEKEINGSKSYILIK
ncbi:MAG TPA: GNAT family N-acetyltransferase [Ignavibacteria bacterium]|nr:GNAT family N-acetyltransferase [Ignavibacteria bacterium]